MERTSRSRSGQRPRTSIYTTTFPLVIGHESLANFVRVVSRRPIICKIHRDLLLGPKNDHRSLRRLHESWAAALRALFSQYTPIFIGYGGNDDSLMDLLESLDPQEIKGQLIWCYYHRDEPSERIVDLVAQFKGALVPVPDFDLLMVQIGDKMKIEPIDDAIETRAAERARKYREQLIALDTTAYPEARRILRGAFGRAGGTLAWMAKINSEVSTARRKQLFEHALEEYPNDLRLQLNYARFLCNHSLELDHCRAKLEQLRAHDAELNYSPSQVLVELQLLTGQIEDAKAMLASLPTGTWSHSVNAFIAETIGDLATAEIRWRLAGEKRWVHFLFRQRRFDECIPFLENHQDDPTWAMTAAYFQWMGRKDPTGGCKILAERVGLESLGCQQSLSLVVLALLTDDLETAAAAIAKLDSMSKQDWWDETSAAMLGLFHALRLGSIDERRLELTHQQFASSTHSTLWMSRVLLELAEALSPKLPKAHRKFVIDLAKAYYAPSLRAGLNVYEVWRKAADSSA
jgi:hypothetical protein